MKPSARFTDDVLSLLGKTKALRIRAGNGTHRFIGIWFVIVEQRVFVRSWSIKPDGWYRAFLSDSRGAIKVGKSEIAVRAVPIRGKTLRDSVDAAYLVRYNMPGARSSMRKTCARQSRGQPQPNSSQLRSSERMFPKCRRCALDFSRQPS
jgi:hypothetical protein